VIEAPDLAARWRGRLDRLVPSAFLVALAFVQRPGWTAADTKLDLVVDPAGFLQRALSLWDPLAAGGQLQNQAYGYLFPMGPFFWLGHTLGLPAWVVQRLWWAVLLVLAYHGALRVLERLGIGTGWSRVIGAFSYALAPRMLIGLGAISSEIWPMAVAPWVLLPLLAVQPGRERAAALRSGGAVLLLGAVNAVASLAVLVLPLWWVLTRRGRVRIVLLGWWSLAVVMATAWWIGPLVLLGRYSPPFLDWIEDGRVTTAVASVTEALRGTTQWIATIGGEQSAVWPAGWVALTSRNAILFGLVVVLAGLFGLAAARGPWTVFARGGLLIGLVLVTFGHVRGVAAPWAGTEADLLDGVLAPFRNTHKFEPVLRLPIVLGVAHGLPLAVAWLRRQQAPWPRIAPAVVVLAIVGQTAVPAFVGTIQRGPFLEVPAAWAQASAWLDEHPDQGRTLVLPGGNAPARMWGEPKDEPLQPLAGQPWMVRDAVPLGSAAATRILGEIEARVAQGRGGPELLSMLDTLAVTRVLLVGDHQRATSRTTPPVVVRAALTASGARSVTAFGGIVGGSAVLTTASDWGLDRPVRELELFEVGTRSSIAPTGRVPVPSVARYTGGPEGVASIQAVGDSIFTAEPDPAAASPGILVTTDTLQRRQSSFATATDLYGPLLAADEDYPSLRAVHDYWPDPLDEDTADLPDQQTVRHDDGDARAVASSTLAEPALGQVRELASDAWRAFDSSGETGWRSAGYAAKGQWVQVSWAAPEELPASLTLTLDTERGANVAAVSVVTDTGTRRTPVTSPELAGDDVDPARYAVPVEVPAGATRSLRLVVEAVRDALPTVRVLDLGVGVLPRVEPSVRLPVTERAPDLVALQASTDDRPACYPLSSGVLACSPDRRRVGEEATVMRRLLTLGAARSYAVSGTTVATGTGADDLLRRLDGVRARASSRWLPEPGVSPELVVDGDPRTYWASDPTDATPTLTVTWPTTRTVNALRFSVDPDVAGRRPTEVDVTVRGRTFHRVVDRDGVVSFPDTRVREVVVKVTDTTDQDSLTATGARTMPVVVGEVSLNGTAWPAPASPGDPVVVPCGFGPTVQIGGRTYPTTVTTTRARVLERGDASLRVCGEVDLGAGEQALQTLASGQFAVRSLLLDGRAAGSAQGSEPVAPVGVATWGNTDRSVDLVDPAAVDTLLVVRENANPGWVARVGETVLRPTRVDGWAQGWVVPAGVTGTVELRFTPQRAFVAFLAVGAALAVVLAALALRAGKGAPAPVLAEVVAPTTTTVLSSAALVLVGGLTGLLVVGLALVARLLRPRRRVVMVLAAGAAVSWVGWALWQPWPALDETNRDVASGALGLFLVALATTWSVESVATVDPADVGRVRQRRNAHGRRGATSGPGLDGRLEDVPAHGRHGEGRREGQDHGDPEAVGEDLQSQQLPHPEHQR
jgi:arabinofuranan 3-O-arabinosyltransferase